MHTIIRDLDETRDIAIAYYCVPPTDVDADSDWLTEFIDHADNSHMVALRPGDMVFYESASVLHGRPRPLRGRFYANLFVHFAPVNE